MRKYGRKIAALLGALALCVSMPLQVMAETAAGSAATGDETPIIAVVLCIVGVAIIVVALRKRNK